MPQEQTAIQLGQKSQDADDMNTNNTESNNLINSDDNTPKTTNINAALGMLGAQETAGGNINNNNSAIAQQDGNTKTPGGERNSLLEPAENAAINMAVQISATNGGNIKEAGESGHVRGQSHHIMPDDEDSVEEMYTDIPQDGDDANNQTGNKTPLHTPYTTKGPNDEGSSGDSDSDSDELQQSDNNNENKTVGQVHKSRTTSKTRTTTKSLTKTGK